MPKNAKADELVVKMRLRSVREDSLRVISPVDSLVRQFLTASPACTAASQLLGIQDFREAKQ